MSSILLATSSPRADSFSTRIATEFAEGLLAANPGSSLTRRDLAANPIPHINGDFASGVRKPREAQTSAEAAEVQFSDELVDELLAADQLVIGTGLLNFNISSNLKSWIDQIARAGKTFRYGPNGPEGLVTAKKAYVVLASGGIYSEGAMTAFDHATPYLKAVFGFIGITDIALIRVEGVGRGPEAAANALSSARSRIASLIA